MAFVASSLGAMGDTNARSAYTCPLSDTPENNALVLVSVLAADAAGTAVEPTGVVGANLTFSIVTSSVSFDTIASVAKNLSVWRAMGSGLVNSVVTATFSNAATGCCITVDEITGVPSGSNGANAVGQSATSRSEAISAVTVIGPSALSTANGWLVAYGVDNSGAGDAPDASLNYQHLSRATHETPVTALESAWTALSGGNTVGIRGAGAQNRGAIIVELDGESGGGGGGGSISTSLRRPPRLAPIPSDVTGPVARLLGLWKRQFESEGYISLVSTTNPNTSGVTGIPGNVIINIGSASTWTRMWINAGTSIGTTGWQMVRMA
jgi:hypothetical protein